MASKVLVICVSALLVQSIAGGCVQPRPSCGCSSGNVDNISIGNGGCSTSYLDNISVGSVGYNRGVSEIVSVSSPSVVVNGANSIYRNANSIVSNPSSIVSSPIAVSGPALASSGGPFITTSIGSIVPSGIRVDSTNELYGELLVSGAMPYLTAVAFEGSFPNEGVASVAYGCGTGDIAITEIIGGAAQSASYNNAILPAANYNNAILPAANYNNAILPAANYNNAIRPAANYNSCAGPILPPPNCGCNKTY